jgi:transposase
MVTEPTLGIATIIAVIGSPGVVWWLMRRLVVTYKQDHRETCAACKAEIEKRIERAEAREKEIEERQFKLRQADIPHIRETFAKKVDLEVVAAEIKRDIKDLGTEIKTEFRGLKESVSRDIIRLHDRIDNSEKE